MQELWKTINGYEDYEVSNQGRIRSNKFNKVKILKPGSNSEGYKQMLLSDKGTQRSFLVHRLVLEAFAGPAPKGLEVRHIDGNPGNNDLTNLAYGTHQENLLDRRAHKTNRGPKCWFRDSLNQQIIELLSAGKNLNYISEVVGASRKTVSLKFQAITGMTIPEWRKANA